jgi:hypothetical protein
MSSPRRASRRLDEKLLHSYASEAARLREYAASTTTARLKARLLEAAAEQERLAAKVNAGQTGFATIQPEADRPSSPKLNRWSGRDKSDHAEV